MRSPGGCPDLLAKRVAFGHAYRGGCPGPCLGSINTTKRRRLTTRKLGRARAAQRAFMIHAKRALKPTPIRGLRASNGEAAAETIDKDKLYTKPGAQRPRASSF